VHVLLSIADVTADLVAVRAGLAVTPVAQGGFRHAEQLGDLVQGEQVADLVVGAVVV